MNEIQQFIVNDIQPLSLNDSIDIAQDIAIEYKLSHIPVVEDQVYLGCLITEDAEHASANTTVADFKFTLDKFYVLNTTNWFDVLQIFSKNETNIVPVLDAQNKYIGFYELNDCIKILSETPFLTEEGSTIVVEKPISTYTFSEVAQIIESNNSKILGFFISNFTDTTVQLSIKMNTGNLNGIIQTFRRYDYNIVSEHTDDSHVNNLKDNSEYLNKYLNI
jgi:predicted transcriptional regulator